ncbi:hypothetical protein [Alloprevotella tannerae]|jgi:hypothetical protein|uniref:RipA family octameric membrane protein n=1 Tax=Alloprevotella tannerae TaxID=76122 RepID=UPI0028E3E21E|nr:hypothetical protein [Alloprevotella tannerae]
MKEKKRGISKEDYIKEYDKEKLEEAFKIALDTRKFEIELYWKRTGYFVLFIGAVFVGYCNIINTAKEDISKCQQEWLLLLLSALGFLLSLLWYMANRGSKFWQENWEAHIKELSTHLGVPIFGIIKRREHSIIRNPMQEYPFSVSKVNQMVSLIITFAWLLMLCKEMGVFKSLENIPFSDWDKYKMLAGGIVIMLSFLIIICCKGFAAKESRKRDKLEKSKLREWVSNFIANCRDKITTPIKNLFTKSTESKKEVSDYFRNYNTNIYLATSQTSNKITKEDPMQTENKQR